MMTQDINSESNCQNAVDDMLLEFDRVSSVGERKKIQARFAAAHPNCTNPISHAAVRYEIEIEFNELSLSSCSSEEQKESLARFLDKYPGFESVIADHVRDDDLKNAFDSLVSSSTLLPRSFGDFENLKVYASGGMGTVFRGHQVTLDREVAIKAAQVGRSDRFANERRCLAQFYHPNIVPIYDYGQFGKTEYLVMPFIEGSSLDQISEAIRRLNGLGQLPVESISALSDSHGFAPVVGNSNPTVDRQTNPNNDSEAQDHETINGLGEAYFKEVATIVAKIAEAIDIVHSKGIIHRDLKPHNIVIDRDGVPHVLDFGLASLVTEERERKAIHSVGGKKTQQYGGTPAYSAPEQYNNQYSVHTDVWGIGTILYQLLTCQSVYLNSERSEPRKEIIDLCPQAPADLIAIADRCLELDPQDRYPTADSLRIDLDHFLADRPVSVRRPGLSERIRKWRKREPVFAAIFGVSAIALILIVGLLVYHLSTVQTVNSDLITTQKNLENNIVTLGRTESQLRLALSESNSREVLLLRQKYNREMRDGFELAETGVYLPVQQKLNSAVADEGRSDIDASFSNIEHRFLANRLASSLIRKKFETPVSCIGFTVDGHLMAGDEGGRLHFMDFTSNQWKVIRRHDSEIRFLASLDKENVISVGRSGVVRIGKPLHNADQCENLQQVFGEVRKVAWDSKMRALVITDAANKISVARFHPDQNTTSRVDRFELPNDFLARNDRIVDLNLVSKTDVLLVGLGSGAVVAFDLTKPTEPGKDLIGRDLLTGEALVALDSSADDKSLIVLGNRGTLVQVDIATGELVRTAKVLDSARDIQTLGKSETVVTGASSRLMRLNANFEVLQSYTGFDGSLDQTAFDFSGTKMAVLTAENKVVVQKIQGGRDHKIVPTSPIKNPLLFLLQQGNKLLMGNNGPFPQPIQVVDTNSGSVALELGSQSKAVNATGDVVLKNFGHSHGIGHATMSENGDQVATGSSDGTVKIWDSATGKCNATLKVGQPFIIRPTCLLFHPTDSGLIVIGATPRDLAVWSIEQKRLITRLEGHSDRVTGIVKLPESDRFLTCSWDGSIRMWDSQQNKCIETIYERAEKLNGIRISDDGRFLAAWGQGNQILLLEQTPTGYSFRKELVGHSGYVNNVAFTADSQRLVSSSPAPADQSVLFWDLELGTVISRIPNCVWCDYSAVTKKLIVKDASPAAMVRIYDLSQTVREVDQMVDSEIRDVSELAVIGKIRTARSGPGDENKGRIEFLLSVKNELLKPDSKQFDEIRQRQRENNKLLLGKSRDHLLIVDKNQFHLRLSGGELVAAHELNLDGGSNYLPNVRMDSRELFDDRDRTLVSVVWKLDENQSEKNVEEIRLEDRRFSIPEEMPQLEYVGE